MRYVAGELLRSTRLKQRCSFRGKIIDKVFGACVRECLRVQRIDDGQTLYMHMDSRKMSCSLPSNLITATDLVLLRVSLHEISSLIFF